MALRDDIPCLLRHIEANANILKHNYELLDIYEGNLLPYVEADLQAQLSPQSYAQAKHRITPLNILRQVMDKLSRIYPPTRQVVNGSDQDAELLAWYEAAIKADQIGNQANEFFNLFKSTLLEPYVWDGKPGLRAIPSDRFLPYTASRINPTVPTHFVTMQGDGDKKSRQGEVYKVKIYFAYTADEWLVFDSDGDLREDLMFHYGNPEGINPYGVLPFVYVNRSQNCLVPKPDTDIMRVTRVIPVCYSDMLFISQFSSFSIIYGVDVDDENLNLSPNAFWSFKSDPNSEKTPQVNQIKPQGDIDQLTRMIQGLLGAWMQTRGIKTNYSGSLQGDNMASGVAKMIDELDTYQDRQKQTGFFMDAEEQLWNLILKDMHPVWVQHGMLNDPLPLFSPSADFNVNFSEQMPFITRGDLVDDLQAEVAAGFTTRARAIKALNPRMSDDEIDELLAEIEGDAGMMDEPETMDDDEAANGADEN